MGLFDGIISAVTAPVASIIGGITGGIGQSQTNQKNWDIAQSQNQTSMEMQESAQNFNADQARIDREFQASQAQIGRDYATNLSNTAYQRAVGDMKAAGLNPMLAYMQGGASSSPTSNASGSKASVSQSQAASVAPMGNVGAAIVSGAQSGLQMMNMKETNNLISAQANEADERANLTRAKTFNELDINPKVKKELDLINAEISLKQQLQRFNSAQTSKTNQDIIINKGLEEYSKNFGQLSPALKDLGNLGHFLRYITK